MSTKPVGSSYLRESCDFIVGGSVERLNQTTSAQRNRDILHSTLYAQLLADGKEDRGNVDSWYREYVLALRSVGWQLEGFEFQQYTPSGIFFQFSSIINSGDPEKTPLRLEASKLSRFHEISVSKNTTNFQALYTQESTDSEERVTFAGYFALMPQNWMDRITLLRSKNTPYLQASMPNFLVKLFRATQIGIFKEELYSVHRANVLAELNKDNLLSELIKIV